jgi:hypothetical protein
MTVECESARPQPLAGDRPKRPRPPEDSDAADTPSELFGGGGRGYHSFTYPFHLTRVVQ